MTYGTLAKAFNSNNVRLLVGLGNTSPEMITVYILNKLWTNPRFRVNSRAGSADFFAAPLLTVTVQAVVSKDVLQLIEGYCTPSSRGVITAQPFTVYAESISGNTADDITTQFDAYTEQLATEGPENGWYTIRFNLVIQFSTYVTS